MNILTRVREWLAASRRNKLLAMGIALGLGGGVAAAVVLAASSGDDERPEIVAATGTPSPPATRTQAATPAPTPPPQPQFPVLIDAQELFVVDAEGGEPVLLHQTTSYYQGIEWSPDGRRIAFAVGGTEGKIYVVDQASIPEKPAVEVAGYVEALMWSPDGKFIAYQASASDSGSVSREISLLETASGSVRPLLSGGEEVALADWFPNGRELLIIDGAQLAMVEVASGDRAELGAAFEGRTLYGATVSLDASSVAAAASGGGGACQIVDPSTIFIVSVADGARYEAVSETCGARQIAWSPDGAAIAWADYQSGPYVLNIGENQPRRLADARQSVDIEWLADGSGVTVIRCYEGCYEQLFASLDGTTRVLAQSPDRRFAGFGGFAPDSRRYLYSDDAVRVASIDGQETEITEADPDSAYASLGWSPDGKRVAYVREANGNTRAHSVNLETAQVTRLPTPSILGAVPSPDGSLLAFLKPKEAGEGSTKLWIANADGSGERLVADTNVSSFAWSPDSRLIAFSSSDTEGLHTVDVQTSAATQLSAVTANYRVAGFSPDGSSLAVARGSELVVIDTESGESKVLVASIDVPYFGEPWRAWSPDGTMLAYNQRDAAGISHIGVVDVITIETRQLTQGSTNDLRPVWSPDGGSIAFLRTGASGNSLHVVNVVGGERELARFAVVGGSASELPAWSPDGDRIAFFMAAEDAPGIYVIGADGAGLQQVAATGRFDNRGIEWSDDGKEIKFSSYYSGI